MPTLLSPQPRSFSIRTRNLHSAVGNHSTLQSSHCFAQTKKTFSPSFTQSLLSLVFIVGLFGKLFCLDDGLGRRVQTSSGENIINYYYNPEVEFLELGHNINGSCTWNLYGPDRSGFYGGVQGIGGLESSYNQDNETTKHWFNNYFGDAIGWYDSTNQSFSAYQLTLGAYGPMLGSPIPRVSDPQWRGHYIDETGFYYMGTRYYDPINGRFLSPDPLGHSSSLGLYDYCNGDPVNGLDPDGRCVEGASAGWANGNGSFAGTYDSSQASSQLAYGLGWTVGGAFGDVNAMVARPIAYAAAGAVGLGLYGLNAAVESTEEYLGGPGARGAIGFMAPLMAMETEAATSATAIEESTSSVFSAGYQGGPGAMWRGEKLEATLPADIAATFRGGKYASHVLQSDVQAFRFSGGASFPIGRFLTTSQTVTGISNPEEAISVLKLPSGATATQLDALMIPQGERVFYGRVEGGSQRATQLFIENPGVLRPIQ